jgi:hypothetical protein
MDDIVLFRNENKLTGRKMAGHAKNSASIEPETIGPTPVDSNNVSPVNKSVKKLPYLSMTNRSILNLVVSSEPSLLKTINKKLLLSKDLIINDQRVLKDEILSFKISNIEQFFEADAWIFFKSVYEDKVIKFFF